MSPGTRSRAARSPRWPARLRPRLPTRDERGQSVSVLVVLVVAALIMVTGLVIDGGQKTAADSAAEVAAAGAARAAGNALARDRIEGTVRPERAVAAARDHLRGHTGVQGSVRVVGGRVRVRTSTTRPTFFLNLLGVTAVHGSGSAEAEIVAVR